MKRDFFKQLTVFSIFFFILSFASVPFSWATSTPTPGQSGSQKIAQKINVNKAGIDELTTLPGIGPKTASRIIASREADGFFKAPQDLLKVKGIGQKSLNKIADLISFE